MKKREPAGEGRNRRQKIRPLAAFLLAAALVITALQIPGVAAKAAALDLEKQCSLTVTPSGDPNDVNDLKGNVAIDLYKVADAEKAPGYDTYGYKLLDAYQDALNGMQIPATDNTGWKNLAQAAAKVAMEGEAYQSASAEVEITGLEPGLYLIIPRDANPKQETVAGDTGNTEDTGEGAEAALITTQVQTERYIYTFEPELVSIPGKDPVDGVVSTANPGEWKYDMEATLKPTREERKGSLEITKTVSDQTLMTEPATFVFQVNAYLDKNNDGEDELVYSNVVGMTFTGESQQKVTLAEAIPVGSHVVVKEIYSGATYTMDTGEQSEDMLSAETVLQMTFSNTRNDRHKGGHGIVNSFTYNGSNWDLVQNPAGTE